MKKNKNKILTISIGILFTLAIISFLLAVWIGEARWALTGCILLMSLIFPAVCLDFWEF